MQGARLNIVYSLRLLAAPYTRDYPSEECFCLLIELGSKGSIQRRRWIAARPGVQGKGPFRQW
jgi:hypothetical protein